MQRLLLLAALCVCATVSAQTVIDVTLPNNAGVCSYTTGPVTSGSTAGHLQATATTSTGSCGSSGPTSTDPPVSFGPASPLAPPTASLGNAGGQASFTFQPINATQCNANVTPSTGVTVTNPICNGAAACAGLQSFAPSFPANASNTDVTYTVGVSCTGLGSPNPGVASPATAQVTVSSTPVVNGTCPTIPGSGAITSFTQLTGNVNVNYYSSGTHSVNITQYNSIFGQIPSTAAWPGNSGTTAVITLPTINYISAAFTVPPGYMASAPSNRYGEYYLNPSAYSKAPVSMTISTSCGDFSNPATHASSTVVPGCYKNKATADTPIVYWENPNHTSPSCVLNDNQSYYLNIINADISNVQPIVGNTAGGTATTTKTATGATCTTAGCTDPIENYIFN